MRIYPRIDSDIPVQCATHNGKLRARALNLGGGGVFLDLAPPELLHSEVSVLFRPGRRAQAIKAHIVARHHSPGLGVGFEFTDIAPADRERILRMVLSRSAKDNEKSRMPLVTQVQHAGGSFLAFSRYLNTAGMFFETRETLPMGAEVLVRFRLGDNEKILAARAEIVYEIRRSGLGIKWAGLTRREIERIEAYLAGRPAPDGWAIDQREEPGIFGVS